MESKMSSLNNKVFIFKIGNYNQFGGAETQSFIFAKYLKAQYNARIIFIADGGEGDVKKAYQAEGFETLVFNYRLKGTSLQKLMDSIRFILLLRKLKPDYILPYTSDNCKKILPGWRFTGAKYAWWNMQDEGRFLYKTEYEKRLLKNVSAIVSNSLVGSQFLSDNYGIPISSIKQYNNPIAIPDKTSITPHWRQHLGLDTNTHLVCMLANLTRWKDHATLLKAWKIVQNHFEEKNQKVFLALAGACKEATNDLKVIAFDLNICHTIKFLGSIQTTNELIIDSDLVVHSSLKEGVPNAICEAMALEKAIVATDIPGNREALTSQFETVCLSIPQDANDLAKKIIALLEDNELRDTIGRFNKERIKTQYTQEQMFDVFVNSFHSKEVKL